MFLYAPLDQFEIKPYSDVQGYMHRQYREVYCHYIDGEWIPKTREEVNLLYALFQLLIKPNFTYAYLHAYKAVDTIRYAIIDDISDYGMSSFSALFLSLFLFINVILVRGYRQKHYTTKVSFLPTRLQFFYEQLIYSVGFSLLAQSGQIGLRYIPLITSVFVYIVMSNIMGLIPFHFTTTAQIVIPVIFATTFALYFTIVGCFNLGFVGFIMGFIPSGVPALLVPFLFVIEVFSYLLRALSLSLRLFANLLAGHILLYILGSFVFIGYFLFSWFIASSALFLYVAIFFLEVLICVIQAYVFATLLTIYASDALERKKH